jgi:mannose-6-phosphate isomerase-like protein (cupin superfamily)
MQRFGGAKMINAMASLISTPAAAAHGAQLIFETLTADVTLRLRPHEDTLLRVIDGVAELRFDGEEHLLGPGGEAIVPAGFHHTLCSVTGQARIVMGYRQPRD